MIVVLYSVSHFVKIIWMILYKHLQVKVLNAACLTCYSISISLQDCSFSQVQTISNTSFSIKKNKKERKKIHKTKNTYMVPERSTACLRACVIKF